VGIFSRNTNSVNALPVSGLGTWQETSGLTVQTLTIDSLYPGLDLDELPMYREEAEQIPGVGAVEKLLTATIGALPLEAVDADGVKLPNQPLWMTRSDAAGQTPYMRNTRTILDILFNGHSLWSIDAKGANGYPLAMSNVWHQFWTYDPQSGSITVNGLPVDPAWYVLITAPTPGLLVAGGLVLRSARDIQRTVRARARVAMPTVYLRNTDTTGNSEPTQAELTNMITTYTEARRSRNGTVAYVPGQYDLKTLEESDANWLLAARDAVIGDIAKLTGIPAGLLEGQNSSMNYTTEVGQVGRLTDLNIRAYIDPITSRLSAGDVTPSTTSVQFDLSSLQSETPSPLTDKGTPVPPTTEAKEPADV
jgi:hypothetical protein